MKIMQSIVIMSQRWNKPQFFMVSLALFINDIAISKLLYGFLRKVSSLVILFLLLGLFFIDVFKDQVQVAYTLWLSVSYHYTIILLLMIVLSNCLVGNWHNVIKIPWPLSWFSPFECLFEGSIPLTVFLLNFLYVISIDLSYFLWWYYHCCYLDSDHICKLIHYNHYCILVFWSW